MKRVIEWISAKVLDKILATIISGGGGLIAYLSPIIQHTGIPLAILIGATFGLLLFDVIKRLFFEKQYTGETWFEWEIVGRNTNGSISNCDKHSQNILFISFLPPSSVSCMRLMIEHCEIFYYTKNSPMVQEMTNQSIVIPCNVVSSGRRYYTILELVITDDALQTGQKYKITF